MPRQLTNPQDLLQAEQDEAERRNRLAEIDEELQLYHPDGPWRFLQAQLEQMARSALEALVYCPEQEVTKYRETLKVVRHLASRPDVLREERARLTGDSNE